MSTPEDKPGARLWHNRSFVALFSAQVISLVGSGATTIGLALTAYRMAGTHAATVIVGNALTLRIVAFLVFSQPAGVLADRFDRKAILIVSDLTRVGLLALLPFATTVWHIYGLIFAINAVTAAFTPTYEASVPAVVGEAQIVKALSLSRVAVDVEAVVAPGVAALIVAVVGAQWIFWFDATTYLASALLVACAVIPHVTAPANALSIREFVSEVSYGTRAIMREPSLRQAIALSFVEALAGAAVIVATVTYVQDVLGKPETSVALAMAAVGVGSSLAAIALGRFSGRFETNVVELVALHGRRHEWTWRALVAGGVALGLALLAGVLVPPLPVLIALWALNGAGQALIAIPSATLLAEHTFEEERGRVYAAHFALTHACWLVTYPAIGHAAVSWGAPLTFTVAGIVCLAITAASVLVHRPVQPHAHERAQAAHE